jgi:hypothetical protein
VLERGQPSGTQNAGDLQTELLLIQERRRVLGDLRRVHEEDERLLREEERITQLLKEVEKSE